LSWSEGFLKIKLAFFGQKVALWLRYLPKTIFLKSEICYYAFATRNTLLILIESPHPQNLTNFWLIIIDDIEFADEESIVLLESLITLNTYHLFFVLSKGHQRKLSNNAREVLAHQQITTIRLTPIDIVHVKALICQFLDVVAIPLELERIVCRKGNGNPGWIQNFLVLLTQAQKLKVEQVEIDYAVSIGLIFVELRYRPVDYLDFWDLYATSFSQHAQQTSQEQEGGPNMIKVAIMSSDGQISTFEKDLQADCESITTSVYK
jgi:hypothetical protein